MADIVGFEQIRGGHRAYTRPAAYTGRPARVSPAIPRNDDSDDESAQIVPRAQEARPLLPSATASGMVTHVPVSYQDFQPQVSDPSVLGPDGGGGGGEEGLLQRACAWLAERGITGTRVVNNLLALFLCIQLLRCPFFGTLMMSAPLRPSAGVV